MNRQNFNDRTATRGILSGSLIAALVVIIAGTGLLAYEWHAAHPGGHHKSEPAHHHHHHASKQPAPTS